MLIVASRIAAAPRITAGSDERAAHLQHAADHDDAADRIGHAHQRRVQRRRDVPDHLPADDAGQREHGQVRQERAAVRRSPRPTKRRAPRPPWPAGGADACFSAGFGACAAARSAWTPAGGRRLRHRRVARAWRGGHINSPLAQHQRAAHHFVGEIDVEMARRRPYPPADGQVVAVEQARGGREPARQIDVADDVNAVLLDHLPGSVSAQLPPFSAARSTITDPFFIALTISSVIRIGAGRLGISAVVMMMSTSLACAANIAISASMNAGLISFA